MLLKEDFGKDFKWGISTSAYQIEGASHLEGKGLSIWDVFAQKKKKIFHNDTGNIACDFYNKYTQDISLLYSMNIPHFRFSISWSRIIPEGIGPVNHAGIDFYNRVIDFCLDLGIEPWITLYHWDLPYELEKKGGWTNREVLHWFSYYVECCMKHFGDRVKNWMVLNEPMVFTGAGYFLGIHAPGRKGISNFLAATHHAALCQAEGGRLIRTLSPSSNIGTTFSCSHIAPFSSDQNDVAAAQKMDTLLNRLFLEPLLGMGYPVQDLTIIRKLERFIKDGDEAKLAFQMDFIGVQNYTREVVKHGMLMPFINARIVKASKRKVETTVMDWEVYPEGIYIMLGKFNKYPGIKEIIVTENGAAFYDEIKNGAIEDLRRMKFLNDYLLQVRRAKFEGVKVNGYFIWTLLDNFEWAEGYHPKFGLVHVDRVTQKRMIKSSGYWYKNFLKNSFC